MKKSWNSSGSTTINCVSGDTKFSIVKSVFWIVQCVISLGFGKKHKNLKFKKWKWKDISQNEFEKYVDISPARLISELFLKYSHIVSSEDHYDILELGPGSNPLLRYSNIRAKSYTGIGFITPKKSYTHEKFYIADINSIDFAHYNFNFLYSHSVLEHLNYDIKLFENLHKTKEALNLQIHIFPSAICLINYFWHGYRVYNLRNVSKLVKSYLDDDNYDVELIGLGGYQANLFYAKQLFNRVTAKIFRRIIFQNNVYNYNHFIDDNLSNFIFSSYFVLIIKLKS